MKNLIKIICLLTFLTIQTNAQFINDLGTFQDSWQIGKNGLLLKFTVPDTLKIVDPSDTTSFLVLKAGYFVGDGSALTNITASIVPWSSLTPAVQDSIQKVMPYKNITWTGYQIFSGTYNKLGGDPGYSIYSTNDVLVDSTVYANAFSGDGSGITGLTTSIVAEGSNLYYLDSRARASISETVTGLTYTSGTGVFSLTSGYVIPTTTQETNWTTAYTKRVDTWNAPITFSSNAVSLTQTGDVLGTTNQVNVSNGTNVIAGTADVTISLPQDIDSTANVKFGSVVSSGNVGSPDFTSQTTGWRVGSNGHADFRSMYIDELHAKSFISDLEQAFAGGQIISKSVAKVYTDLSLVTGVDWATITDAINTITTPIDSLGDVQLVVESFGGYPTVPVFANGDVIRLRSFNRTAGSLTITDAWGSVTLDTDYGASGFNTTLKTQAYTFRKLSGSNITAYAQTLALDYGTSANGIIESTVNDAAGAPYIDVKTWATKPYDDMVVKASFGNLDHITDTDLNPTGFGLYATNVFLSGKIIANSGKVGGFDIGSYVLQNGTDIFISSASKKIAINDTTFGNTGIQLEYNDGTPRAFIGSPTGYMKFDGTQMYIGGDFTSTANIIGGAFQTAAAGNNRVGLSGTSLWVKNNNDNTMYEMYSDADTLTYKLTSSKFGAGTLVKTIDGSNIPKILELKTTFYDIGALTNAQHYTQYNLAFGGAGLGMYFGSTTNGVTVTDGSVSLLYDYINTDGLNLAGKLKATSYGDFNSLKIDGTEVISPAGAIDNVTTINAASYVKAANVIRAVYNDVGGTTFTETVSTYTTKVLVYYTVKSGDKYLDVTALLKTSNSSHPAYMQLYINNGAVSGETSTTSTSDVTKTVSVDVSGLTPGDLAKVELRIKPSDAGYTASMTVPVIEVTSK